MTEECDAARIEGMWQMIRAELGGERAPEMVTAKTSIEFRDGLYVVRFSGSETDRGTYSIGVANAGRTITLYGKRGVNIGRTIPGLYQLVGDRLRISYWLSTKTPLDFSSASASPHYVAWYRRNNRLL